MEQFDGSWFHNATAPGPPPLIKYPGSHGPDPSRCKRGMKVHEAYAVSCSLAFSAAGHANLHRSGRPRSRTAKVVNKTVTRVNHRPFEPAHAPRRTFSRVAESASFYKSVRGVPLALPSTVFYFSWKRNRVHLGPL